MPDCSYCDASFDDEEALLCHMKATHGGELGTIDQRRVADVEIEDSGLPTGPLLLVGIIGLAILLVVYVVVFLGGNGGVEASEEPGPYGEIHEHGTIEMTVLGEEVDFTQPEYVEQAQRFHFHPGEGEIWHVHARGVTLEWAMATLDIGVTEDSVTYQGTTYRDSDPEYDVIVEVNGESVDPGTYVLQGVEPVTTEGGDHVRIEVRRANGSSG